MRRLLRLLVLAAALCAAASTAHACQGTACADYTLRVRFWDLSSFSAGLHERIGAVMETESNATYPFKPGAVSRDLGAEIVREWQAGTARTVRRCVSGRAQIPGSDWKNFTACPGQNRANPEEAYVEWKLSRAALLAMADPTFAVEASAPQGCAVFYYVPKNRPGLVVLDTRGTRDGENELLRSAGRLTNAGTGMSLNIIFRC